MLHRSHLVTAVLIAAVAPALANETTGVVLNDQVTVRGAPNDDAKTFPTPLMAGDHVTVVGRDGVYLKVVRKAFVHGRFVAEGRVANCSFLNVRATRNGQVVKALAAGTPVRETGRRNGDWLEIETVGFVPMSQVRPLTAERAPAELVPLDAELDAELLQDELAFQDAETEPTEPTVIEDEGLPLPSLGAPLVKLEPVEPLELEPLELEPLELEPTQLEPLELEPTPLVDVPSLDDPAEAVASDAQALTEISDLDLQAAEELLAELERDPEGMFEAHQESFDDRQDFEASVDACRQLCAELRALQTDTHGIAGSYELSRGRIGKNPRVVLTITPSGLRDHYVVDRTRSFKEETIENLGGVGKWDASKGKLSVEWDRRNGAAQVLTNGADQGDDGAGATAGDYRILAATGEIRGDFASPEEGWAKENGWREGSIKPLEGTYQLEPSWYAFGDKPVTTLTVGAAREDGTFPITRVVAERGISQEGLAERVDDRKLRVSFPGGPRITYTIEENGQVKGTWREPVRGSRRAGNTGDYRAEKGWREAVPQQALPTGLNRTWQGLKRAFKR